MAKIAGFSLKKLNSFIGHEGEELYQGNLYLGNQKIAFWSQDAGGGLCDTFDMCEGFSGQKLDQVFRSYMEKHDPEHADFAGEFFMDELLNLTLTEKRYKKMVKQNNLPIMVEFTDGYHLVYQGLPEAFFSQDDSEEKLHTMAEKIPEQFRFFKNKESQYKVYKSDDFVKGEPVSLDSIVK